MALSISLTIQMQLEPWMFNINTLDWDDEILSILDIPRAMLPKPVPCAGDFGETIFELFGGKLPITGAAGDQQAALFGEACFNEARLRARMEREISYF